MCVSVCVCVCVCMCVCVNGCYVDVATPLSACTYISREYICNYTWNWLGPTGKGY